jgi:MFS family permease
MSSPLNASTEKPNGLPNIKNEELPLTSDVSQKDPLPSTTRIILLAACLTFANVVVSMGNTGVQVMLDSISDDLDISENNLQWIYNSMQLPFVSLLTCQAKILVWTALWCIQGCFVLVAGRAADIWGRRRLFNIGMVVAAVTTLITGFMKNEIAFYIFRAMSGIGGALVASSNIGEFALSPLLSPFAAKSQSMCPAGILAENTSPGRLRSLSIGMCIAGLPLGGAIGFTVAAPLAAATRWVNGLTSIQPAYSAVTSWRSVLYLNAGLDLIPLIGVFFLARHQRETGEHIDRRIDWIGGSLFTAGSVLLFFCLSQALAESKGFGTPCTSFPLGPCSLADKYSKSQTSSAFWSWALCYWLSQLYGSITWKRGRLSRQSCASVS